MDGLREQAEMHSGKREKHPDNPQSSWLGGWVTVSHKINPSESETGKQSATANRFSLNLFSSLFINLFFLLEFGFCTWLMQRLFEACSC